MLRIFEMSTMVILCAIFGCIMNTMTSERRVSGEADYEYKVVNAPTSLLWFRIKRDATEHLLDDLAADGFQERVEAHGITPAYDGESWSDGSDAKMTRRRDD